MSAKSKSIRKVAIAAVMVALVVAFRVFELDRYFTLSFLKESKDSFAALYAQRPLLVVGCYFLIYTLVAALALPGAVVVTLAGGALLGLAVGTAVISFASTIGATLACFISRFLLRDWVQNKFGDKLKTINQGIDQEGALYLFTLRLIPIFPFFMINLVMGLTRLPLTRFYWVSQLGMLPGTLVYVNAGKELGRIDSLSGIVSPSLLVSFAILGLFPITVKKLMGWVRGKRGQSGNGAVDESGSVEG
jgi:uncharacterized membrane protein YdjX (TVP38/TMEM64 family)